MIYVEGAELKRSVIEAIERLATLPELKDALKFLLRTDSPGVIFTEHYKPNVAIKRVHRKAGVTRQYGMSTIVYIRKYKPKFKVPLILHEIVHELGGSELDSEAAEHMLLKKGEQGMISQGEKLAFWKKPKGTFFKLIHHILGGGKVLATCKGIKLWTFTL